MIGGFSFARGKSAGTDGGEGGAGAPKKRFSGRGAILEHNNDEGPNNDGSLDLYLQANEPPAWFAAVLQLAADTVFRRIHRVSAHVLAGYTDHEREVPSSANYEELKRA